MSEAQRTHSLQPTRLTPSASLNRVPLVDLPGYPLGNSIAGRSAGELLAAHALAEGVRRHAGILQLRVPRDAPDADLLAAFAPCLADGEGTQVRIRTR